MLNRRESGTAGVGHGRSARHGACRALGRRQPEQFFGFRPRMTTRLKLAPQVSHTKTLIVWSAGAACGFGCAFHGEFGRRGQLGLVSGESSAEVVERFWAAACLP